MGTHLNVMDMDLHLVLDLDMVVVAFYDPSLEGRSDSHAAQ